MRFDYIEYDDVSKGDQNLAKALVSRLEVFISGLGSGRSQSTAMTKLEETYMWIGKAIRDEQLRRERERNNDV
jgi:hypothetical protein